ncbi:MAG: hypothetical protein ACPG52_08245 [Cognaticolwellia sp.]
MNNKMLVAAGVFAALTSSSVFASSDEGHATPKHIPGVFVGFTNFDGETEFSYGLEYEYKISKKWGAGVVYEKTNDAHHGAGVDVALAAVYLHPWKELRLGLGFGKETVGSYDSDDGHGHVHHHKSHKENLIRTSVSYDFHVGDFGVAPTLAFDFIDGETATIFGVAIVKAF